MIYGKAGLLGYLVATILFMTWPLPAAADVSAQILRLLVFQGIGIAAALLVVPVTRRRVRAEFDLLARPIRTRRRAMLKLVHSRD
jgi:hypothetical protein